MLSVVPLQVVCDFCAQHLEANKAAFADPRLELIYDDARAQLEQSQGIVLSQRAHLKLWSKLTASSYSPGLMHNPPACCLIRHIVGLWSASIQSLAGKHECTC